MPDLSPSPLHDAATSGDIDTLNRLLEDGADVDARDDIGRTALFVASHRGDANAARHLLKRGARVDCETRHGTTALMAAARGGHAAVVRLLLANHADPNQIVHPQPDVVPPELQAKRLEMQEALRNLAVVKGADAADEPARTGPIQANTLARAVMSRNVEAVMALLEAGADVNYSGGITALSPLHLAVSVASPDIVRALIQRGALVDAGNLGDAKALSMAVMKQPVDVARILLEAGARPSADALALAVVKNDLAMIRLLLDFGADPEEEDKHSVSVSLMAQNKPEILTLFARYGGTDWHEFVSAGDVAGVRARLDGGANIEIRSDNGMATALILAATAGHADIARLLLDRGAQVDAGNKFHVTPLMSAAQKGHVAVVQLLLTHGANVNATNKQGQTAFTNANFGNKQEIRDLLIDAGATIGIVEAALLGDHAKVMRFLADGVPVDQPNLAGTTALMAAARNGDIELVTALCDKGADFSLQNRVGDTAFHCAVQHACTSGDTTLLSLMLDRGADINGNSEREAGCLQAPVMRGSEPILRFLLDRGADVNVPIGAFGQPLLHLAIMIGRGKLATIELLIESGADIESLDNIGATPLIQAVTLPPPLRSFEGVLPSTIRDVTRLLLRHGANVNAASNIGSVLEQSIEQGDVDLVRILLDAGADVNGSMTPGPLMRASMQRNPEIIALLRERGASDRGPDEIAAGLPEGFASELVAGATQPGFADKILELMTKARLQKKGSQDYV